LTEPQQEKTRGRSTRRATTRSGAARQGPAEDHDSGARITVWYDYTCGDSYRFKELIDRLGQRARWRTVSLKELSRHDDEPSLFGSPDTDSISVFAIEVTQAARHHDFQQFHEELFSAFHKREAKITTDDVLAIAEGSGLDPSEFLANRMAWSEQAAEEHREAVEEWGVFGTPTLVIDGSTPLYIELSEIPDSPNEAQRIWSAIESVLSTPGLKEVKRVT
jgi:hypothetical protein